MSLPCPICSRVVWNAVPKPIRETPMWHFASNVSQRDEKDFYQWVGCEHAQPLSPTSTFVLDADRKAVEERWDAEAKKLFNRMTMPWAPDLRRAYGEALGFLKPVIALELETPA